ncbi:MAG TPA: hypothetical protein PK859_04190 [Spirochaetota bacterium]|nr:hypothetical protein [Spirochaetota bacterium]HPR48849.1 hypothetical protein [Spirochaetota bacterium]
MNRLVGATGAFDRDGTSDHFNYQMNYGYAANGNMTEKHIVNNTDSLSIDDNLFYFSK